MLLDSQSRDQNVEAAVVVQVAPDYRTPFDITLGEVHALVYGIDLRCTVRDGRHAALHESVECRMYRSVFQFSRQEDILVTIAVVITGSQRPETYRWHADDPGNLPLSPNGKRHEKTHHQDYAAKYGPSTLTVVHHGYRTSVMVPVAAWPAARTS